MFQKVMLFFRRSPKQIFIYILTFLLIIAFFLVYVGTKSNNKNNRAEMTKAGQQQAYYNELLAEKEKEVRYPLRSFTWKETEDMRDGTRTPEEVISSIVEECRPSEPVISGATQEEVLEEYRFILDECKISFTAKMDALIAEAKIEYKDVTSDDENSDLILEYVERISDLETDCDATFNLHMTNMEYDLTAVDGTLDEDDLEYLEAYKTEYNDLKTEQISRFSKEYNK